VVALVRMALGLLAVAVGGILLRPIGTWLEPFGAWALVMWCALLLVVSYIVLAAIEWVIGGVPQARRRPPSTQ
jgi:hypothetical protein